MTIEEAEKYLDHIYYSIEEHKDGKFVHISGDWCLTTVQEEYESTPYRNCEYTWLFIPIEELNEDSKYGRLLETFYEYMMAVKQYEGEYSESEFVESADWMSHLTKLDFSDITLDTPCGDYISKWPKA